MKLRRIWKWNKWPEKQSVSLLERDNTRILLSGIFFFICSRSSQNRQAIVGWLNLNLTLTHTHWPKTKISQVAWIMIFPSRKDQWLQVVCIEGIYMILEFFIGLSNRSKIMILIYTLSSSIRVTILSQHSINECRFRERQFIRSVLIVYSDIL